MGASEGSCDASLSLPSSSNCSFSQGGGSKPLLSLRSALTVALFPPLDVEEANVLGILLDELFAWLDVVSHEVHERLLGGDRIVDRDLQ